MRKFIGLGLIRNASNNGCGVVLLHYHFALSYRHSVSMAWDLVKMSVFYRFQVLTSRWDSLSGKDDDEHNGGGAGKMSAQQSQSCFPKY